MVFQRVVASFQGFQEVSGEFRDPPGVLRRFRSIEKGLSKDLLGVACGFRGSEGCSRGIRTLMGFHGRSMEIQAVSEMIL